jgi:hypothetical protein
MHGVRIPEGMGEAACSARMEQTGSRPDAGHRMHLMHETAELRP